MPDTEPARPAVPFTPTRGPVTAPLGVPSAEPPPRRRDDLGATRMPDTEPARPAMPFAAGDAARRAPAPPPSRPGGPAAGAFRFSINQFASLTAEIAERPGEAESIRQRYGLSEAEHREESQRWTAEFDRNDELRQRYLGIVQRYRGYVRNKPG